MKISDWPSIEKSLRTDASALLGNGFSISCDKSFLYTNLLDIAKDKGLPLTVSGLFLHLKTTNFEEVMHLLEEATYASGLYGCTCEAPQAMKEDIELTKKALVEAIVQVHGAYTNQHSLSEDKKLACVDFLRQFKTIYTLNYDFLLYWVWIRGFEKMILKGQDGFFGPDNTFASFWDGGIRFLHGGLHIYVDHGDTKKYVFEDNHPLLEQVETGLAAGRYPVFIAEGDYKAKLRGMQSQPYLSACLSEFKECGPDLVVFGSSLGPTDQHLWHLVSKNYPLRRLYVATRGKKGDEEYDRVAQAANKIVASRPPKMPAIELTLFPSESVNLWG